MTHEAGVAAPSIYLHFASKGTLPQAVVEEHFVALRRAIELSRQAGDNAASRFLAGRLAYCLYAVDHPGSYRILIQTPRRDLKGSGFAGSQGAAAFQTLVNSVAACIAAGMARPGDPFRIVSDIWSALHGLSRCDGPPLDSPGRRWKIRCAAHWKPSPVSSFRTGPPKRRSPMADPRNVLELPSDLPVPIDDGACDHLPGMRLPALALPATDGSAVDLSALSGRSVVYVYPRTGRPDRPIPAGWDEIPGARGCTPQSCAYRDLAAELKSLGARVFGLSTQNTAYQQEAVARLHLPFPLLSDEGLELANMLSLPTFEFDDMTLIKRLTLIINDGAIETVFYPVFPPDADAANVAAWLRERKC